MRSAVGTLARSRKRGGHELGATGGRLRESRVCLRVITVLAPSLSRKMKLSRQFTVFGSAIFCVVIFSLYLMLDRGHLDYPRSPRREGSFPQVSTRDAELREGRRWGPELPAVPRPLSPSETPRQSKESPNWGRIRAPSLSVLQRGAAVTATREPPPSGRPS